MFNLNKLAALFVVFLSACTALEAAPRTEISTDKPSPSLEKIAEGVWVHKSYKMIEPWGLVLSQGLVIERNGIVVLVDTAWNDSDTEHLLNLVKETIGISPALAVVTHAHADKVGGIRALHQVGIKTFGHEFTIADAPARGLFPPGNKLFSNDNFETMTHRQNIGAGALMSFDLVDVFYPGAGHTRDNIVVYHRESKTLFGGCLIRPGTSKNLGNTADGDIGYWAKAVRQVAERFPDAEIIVPSHGASGGRELLTHTIELAESAAAKQ